MRKVFADTGYWIALLNPDDALHQKARNLTSSLKNVPIVTSEMVFTELLNALSGKGSFYRQKAVNFINHSFNSHEIEVVSQTNELFKSALELYKSRPDQATLGNNAIALTSQIVKKPDRHLPPYTCKKFPSEIN